MERLLRRFALLPVVIFSFAAAATPSGCNEPKVFEGATAGTTALPGSGGAVGSANGGVGAPGAGGVGGTGDNGSGDAAGNGMGGAGAAGGTANQGGSAACVPKAEDCFNSIDDDCDNATDCADSDCQVKATCVPGEGAMALITPGACPTGAQWTAQKQVNSGLKAPAMCPGCACDVSKVSCKPTIYFYSISTSECQGDTSMVGGTLATLKPLKFLSEPPQPLDCQETIFGVQYGARLAKMELVAECSAKGSAQPAPPQWETTSMLCELPASGGGCPSGVCVPAAMQGTWVHLPQNAACPASVGRRQVWYTGVKDERTCSPCGCSVTGGSCADVRVSFANDYGCYGDYAEKISVQFPQTCRGLGYSPGVALLGSVPEPTCSASSSSGGTASPTGPIVTCAP